MDASRLNSKASLEAELLEPFNLNQATDAVHTPEIENGTATTPYMIVDCPVQACAGSFDVLMEQEIDDITQ